MRAIVIINLQCLLLEAGREGGGGAGRGGAAGRGGGGGRAAGEVGIMRKTGVKDGVRTGCEKRKILTSPSPYPFLMSNQS